MIGGYTRVLRVEPREKNEYFSAKKGDKNAIREPKPRVWEAFHVVSREC
jgi:large subunit ribosomal protein L17